MFLINSIQTLTQLFADHKKLDRLENFLSINGPLHYELPLNSQKIKLKKKEVPIKFPNFLEAKNTIVKVFKPPFNVYWEILNNDN